MHTAASLCSQAILAHLEAADPSKVWRLLYLARAASVSVTAVRATLLTVILHLHAVATIQHLRASAASRQVREAYMLKKLSAPVRATKGATGEHQ